MVDIQTLSIAIATASVVAGVIYYSFQLRNQSKTRQTDVLMRLYSTFGSKEFFEAFTKTMGTEFKDYNDFVKKYGVLYSENPVNIARITVGMFFEGLGVLLHRKLVDIDLVRDLFPVNVTWEKMKPLAEGMRKQFNEPRILEGFEYLYNEMQKREQRLQQIQQ